MRFRTLFLCLLAPLLFFVAVTAKASVALSDYNIELHPELIRKAVSGSMDSLYQPRWQASETKVIRSLAVPHHTTDHTVAFYLLLVLAAILGGVKTLYPKYFNDLWRAFLNPTLGNRQLREMIQGASYPNLLMNLFACIVLGVWLFYFTSVFVDWRFSGLSQVMIVLSLICGTCITYIIKYSFVSFIGWVFHMRHTTDLYNFNISLVNKVLGVFLLPFVVCFAFMNSSWASSLSLLSAFLAIVFLANRYFRSWGIFSQFFLNSRFHFFMYLCAFELLPMAVVLKFITKVS